VIILAEANAYLQVSTTLQLDSTVGNFLKCMQVVSGNIHIQKKLCGQTIIASSGTTTEDSSLSLKINL